MIIEGRQVILKRLPQKINRAEDCLSFGTDNLYPQRAKEVLNGSYTLVAIIEKDSGFLNGEGFADPEFAKTIVYQNGLRKITANQLLDKVAAQMSPNTGVALHIGYNLNYEVDHVKIVPWEYCRFGLPDEDGEIYTIRYCTNWEREWLKEEKSREVVTYHRFNPDPEIVQAQIEACGGISEYRGQIYYWTPEENVYPPASFDSVFDQAQTQQEIGVYGLSNVVNGFTAGNIFLYPGSFADDDERKKFKDRMQEHKGAMGANSTMVIETGTSGSQVDGKDLLLKTDLQNNDKLFEFTSNSIEKAMLQRYGMPYPILGKMPDTGMFNKQEVEDAYIYYNSVTRDRRNIITQIFTEIFAYWKDRLSGNFSIIPQKYIVEESNGAIAAPVTTTEPITKEGQDSVKDNESELNGGAVNQPNPNQDAIDSLLRSLSRKDLNKFYGYVNDYKRGRATLDQTKIFMRAFKLTDDQIMLFLEDPELDG